MSRRAATLLALAALCALGSGCGAGSRSRAPGFRGVTVLPPGVAGRPATPIDLPDGRGGTLDTRSLAGRPYAVTFLYTNCPDVCPLIGDEIREALVRLGARASRVAVVAVSVDPRHDNAAAVRAWLSRHREPTNFHYVTGTERQLHPVWSGYFAAPQTPGDPQSAHTAVVWLVDRHGRLAASFDAGAPFDPDDLAHDLSLLDGPG